MSLAPTQLRGATIVDSAGHKVGSASDIYLDNDTDQPEWALVHTGLFGTKSSFVPLAQASVDGDTIRVPYTKDQIKDAPNLDEGGELSQPAEAQLYAYYGLEYSESHSDSGLPQGAAGLSAEAAAVTRSEEELRVGTRAVEAGRVRLRKWVETEPVQTQVHTRRETARVEREPVNAPVVGAVMGEQDIEIALHREEPVLEKHAVAKERIDLVKDVTTEHEQVTAEVRKEHVDVEGLEGSHG